MADKVSDCGFPVSWLTFEIWLLQFGYLNDWVKQFEEAVEIVKKLKTRPTDQELLEIYALYKQATCGDIDIRK